MAAVRRADTRFDSSQLVADRIAESDGSSKANPNRTSNRIVQKIANHAGKTRSAALYFVATAKPVKMPAVAEIAARAGFRQLDDAQEPDEHHARHRDVGHTAAQNHGREGTRERGTPQRRIPSSGRTVALRCRKRSQTLMTPAAALQETRHDSCGGRARLGQPKANLEPRESVDGSLRKTSHSAAATTSMKRGG